MKIEFGKLEFGEFKVAIQIDVMIHAPNEEELVGRLTQLEKKLDAGSAGLQKAVEDAQQ